MCLEGTPPCHLSAHREHMLNWGTFFKCKRHLCPSSSPAKWRWTCCSCRCNASVPDSDYSGFSSLITVCSVKMSFNMTARRQFGYAVPALGPKCWKGAGPIHPTHKHGSSSCHEQKAPRKRTPCPQNLNWEVSRLPQQRSLSSPVDTWWTGRSSGRNVLIDIQESTSEEEKYTSDNTEKNLNIMKNLGKTRCSFYAYMALLTENYIKKYGYGLKLLQTSLSQSCIKLKSCSSWQNLNINSILLKGIFFTWSAKKFLIAKTIICMVLKVSPKTQHISNRYDAKPNVSHLQISLTLHYTILF